MSRYAIQGTVQDGTGSVIEGAAVYLRLVGSTTGATCYAEYSGGTALTDGQTTTDSRGHFIFYVEQSDYPLVSHFDVYVSKTGYAAQTYQNVR